MSSEKSFSDWMSRDCEKCDPERIRKKEQCGLGANRNTLAWTCSTSGQPFPGRAQEPRSTKAK